LSGKPRDIAGKRFGLLTAQRFGRVGANRYAVGLFKCDCGAEKEISTKRLCSADPPESCGCRSVATRKQTVHGHAKERTPEYQSWSAMKERCLRKNHPHFASYGGRGIQVCDRWMSFEAFLADMGPRPSAEYSLERVGNDGHYEPSNCVWATAREQIENRRCTIRLTHAGETLTLAEWSRRIGVPYQTLYGRLKRGVEVEQLLSA
jgi:hypothetical protein